MLGPDPSQPASFCTDGYGMGSERVRAKARNRCQQPAGQRSVGKRVVQNCSSEVSGEVGGGWENRTRERCRSRAGRRGGEGSDRAWPGWAGLLSAVTKSPFHRELKMVAGCAVGREIMILATILAVPRYLL